MGEQPDGISSQAAPVAQSQAGRPFAVTLTWGVVLVLAGILMGLVAVASPGTDSFGNTVVSPWLIPAGMAGLLGLVLMLTGLYELLKSLERHLAVSRAPAD